MRDYSQVDRLYGSGILESLEDFVDFDCGRTVLAVRSFEWAIGTLARLKARPFGVGL